MQTSNHHKKQKRKKKTKGRQPVVIRRRYHFITKKTMYVSHTHTHENLNTLFYYSSPFYCIHLYNDRRCFVSLRTTKAFV